jgi:hypothetical protein
MMPILPKRTPMMTENPRMIDKISAIMITRNLIGEGLLYTKQLLELNLTETNVGYSVVDFAGFLRDCLNAGMFPLSTKEKS